MSILSCFSFYFFLMAMYKVMVRKEEVGNRGGKTFCNFPSVRYNLKDVHFLLK